MICNNDATELCMTKGQEGFVAGWTTIQGPQNQLYLDILFVKLADPPTNVKFEGLPENIVLVKCRGKGTNVIGIYFGIFIMK
jgi:hypothetical protein